MLIFFRESGHCIRNWWIQISRNAHFPQKLQASKYWFLQCSNILIGKFEIGRGLFENFGKLEDGVSKFSNIPIFGRNQMNEPCYFNPIARYEAFGRMRWISYFSVTLRVTTKRKVSPLNSRCKHTANNMSMCCVLTEKYATFSPSTQLSGSRQYKW